MRTKALAWVALVVPACLPATADSLVRNGGFEEGLTGWRPTQADRVTLTNKEPHAGRAALFMDATGLSHEVGAESAVFPVASGGRYHLQASVKQTAGYSLYKVVINWLSADDAHLSYSNDWTGGNCPPEYAAHGGDFVAPPGATQARLLIGVAAGTACLMDDFSLELLPPLGPRLKAYVFSTQPDADGASAVEVRVQNEGDRAADSVRVAVDCPPGLRADGLDAVIPHVRPADSKALAGLVRGRPTDANATLTARVAAENAGTVVASTRPFVTQGHIAPADGHGVPEPHPVRTKPLVGTYYFPVMLDWDRGDWGLRHVDYFTPLLGYYDEALPQVADWHIKWAVEHGIGFFAYDWYYNDGSKYLQDALEKGFLRARYRSLMKFCINWCNEGQCTWDRPLSFSTESLCGFMTYLCEHYFTQPEYLRVKGKPVVMIIRPDPIIEWHRGPDGSRQALDAMREVARRHGEPGVYFMCIGLASRAALYRRAGYDAITAYAYGWADAPRAENGDCEYEDLLPAHERIWAQSLREARTSGLDYMPVVWSGWDDYARAHDRAVRTRGNTAARFRAMCETGGRYTDPGLNLLIIEAWNEWGEGGFLEPSRERGFSFLDAVRDVFAAARGPHQDAAPNAEQVASYETHLTFQQIDADYIRRDRLERGIAPVTKLDWQFDRQADRDAWHGLHDLARLAEEGGALRLRSTGNDPAMWGPAMMEAPTAQCVALEIRMAVDRGSAGQVFWVREGAATSTEAASRLFPLIADGQLHSYRVPLADNPLWQGTICQLRLDPTDEEGATISLAYLRGIKATDVQ